MSKIIVTFEVEDSNTALLMLACHDILTGVPFDESFSAHENFDLVLMHLGIRAQECIDFLDTAFCREPGPMLKGLSKLHNGE